jgi:hypothetical protein
MLFSPSEVGTVSIFLGISLGLRPREIPRKILTVPPSDGENISFYYGDSTGLVRMDYFRPSLSIITVKNPIEKAVRVFTT